MAVISEIIRIGSNELVKHKSDKNMYIRQTETGREYSSAIDLMPCKYTYEETEKPIQNIYVGGEEN